MTYSPILNWRLGNRKVCCGEARATNLILCSTRSHIKRRQFYCDSNFLKFYVSAVSFCRIIFIISLHRDSTRFGEWNFRVILLISKGDFVLHFIFNNLLFWMFHILCNKFNCMLFYWELATLTEQWILSAPRKLKVEIEGFVGDDRYKK